MFIKEIVDEFDGTEPIYRKRYDINGNAVYVEEPDPLNVQEFISSFRNGCSLKSVLDRCSLMPTAEKIAYLQQNNQSIGCDLTAFPKDGTEALILLNDMAKKYPGFYAKVKELNSFTDAFKAYFNSSESEVNNNGKNESSND